MDFGKSNESSKQVKFYTGVENFLITAVSPNKAEVEALIGREITYDPSYTDTETVKDSDGEREAKKIRVDFFIVSEGEEPISTKVSFYVIDTYKKSQTGKLQVINSFGESTWLTQEHIDAKTTPDNMSWYDTTGVKIAKRGEVELIGFLKSLLNIAANNDKLVNKKDGYAVINPEQWAAIFAGDFSGLRDVVNSTNNKIGLVLGVKTATDNKLKQVIFNRSCLRQYVLHQNREDKYKWINKNIVEAQANGAYPQVDFGSTDYALREYSLTSTPLTASNGISDDDAFAVAPGNSADNNELDF